jgi:Lon protease-like protein
VPRLRLFLLNTVLFPGQTAQLVVFEPRYHQLVRECLESGEPFGIALIRSGPEVGGPATPFSTGTTARIQHANPLPDGRTALEVLGERRFVITSTVDDQPYPSATVEYLPDGDDAPAVPEGALAHAAALYREVLRQREVATGQYERAVETPATAGALAGAIGALGLGPAAERQRVLEAEDAGVRLARATQILEAVLPNVRQQARRAVSDRTGGPKLN